MSFLDIILQIGILIAILMVMYRIEDNKDKIKEIHYIVDKYDDFHLRIKRLERAVIDLNEDKIKRENK